MWPGTLLFCVFIDFLSWHVLSLTALIITYIQMIFKFTHFQPFQMMSPFALPQIWLPSCLGWATVFSDWIWMRWRLCHLVVNKPQNHGSSFTPLIAWAASEGQGCSMTELSPTIPLSQGINLHKTSKDICQLPSFPFLARILFISWLKLCHGPWQTPSKPPCLRCTRSMTALWPCVVSTAPGHILQATGLVFHALKCGVLNAWPGSLPSHKLAFQMA